MNYHESFQLREHCLSTTNRRFGEIGYEEQGRDVCSMTKEDLLLKSWDKTNEETESINR